MVNLKLLKFLLFFVLLASLSVKAQNASYRILHLEMEGTSDVRMEMIVYCKKKKKITYEAKLAAVRTILYTGTGYGVFARPLMPDGEITTFQEHPYYLSNLYDYRLDDFIEYVDMASDYKKADKNQGTHFIVCVKALLLRRDLEKNNVITKMGL